MRILAILILFSLISCASQTPKPLTYLSLSIPQKAINTKDQKSVTKEFTRGGWFIGNSGFRPAVDVSYYLSELQKEAGTLALKDADLQSTVPFAVSLFFFGYNHGTDVVSNNSGMNNL